MKVKAGLVLFILFITAKALCAQKFDIPPAWAKEVVWYQIFVERFYNGDTSNDPAPGYMNTSSSSPVPDGWKLTPWTQDWYRPDDWMSGNGLSFYPALQYRRYGGDLQGVLDKVEYLEQLGITAVYFNPLNDAPSLHKYDARNYRHIDVNFGPDPEGDMNIMASEDPADPATWKWTSADLLFLKVVKELHKRGIRVILDYSWNHTGVDFWAFKDIVKNGARSKYKDWYEIESFDDPATPENEFRYKGWLNIMSLPEIKKVNVTGKRTGGLPYEGNINEGAKRHIFAVTRRWLAPNGDVASGIDGFRLDVADQIPMGFWREYRKFVKSINPEAYLTGEIWWEHWPDKLMNPEPYLRGDIFDAVMFYQIYRPARCFFAKTGDPVSAEQLTDSLNFQWNRLKKTFRYAMMNVAATHDSPRLLTSFYNGGKYKYHAKPNEDPDYRTGKPDNETCKRVKLYLVHQFTNIGAPHIWNGDEMGMWGADDPDCRKPLWWPEYNFEPETRTNIQPGPKKFDPVGFNKNLFDFYKKLIRIRKENGVLISGELTFLKAKGKLLVYKRENDSVEIIVAVNAGEKREIFHLPAGSYRDLLTGTEVSGGKYSLKPFGAVILKK